jgi:predicted transcriptional regulator
MVTREVPMPVLTHLRRLREERAMSQRDLAEKAGLTQATIVHAEAGALTRHVTVRKLAAALHVNPIELMGTDEQLGNAAA